MELSQNPYYIKALEFIDSHDLNSLETGKHIIYGDHLWVNIVDADLRPQEKAKLEAHDRYIDIQVPLSKAETFGIKPRVMCSMPDGEFNQVNDIIFFNDDIAALMTVEPGKIITFGPETAHAPLIGEGKTHKAIFKVEVV